MTVVLSRSVNNIAIAILIVSWIGSYPWDSQQFRKVRISAVGWSAILLLVSYAISFLWTEDLYAGIKVVEVLAPLLIFPVVLQAIPQVPHLKAKIIKAFIYTIVAILLVNLVIAIIRTGEYGLYYKDPEQTVIYNNFFYHGFASGVGIHPSFLSLFCAFGILALLNLDKVNLSISKHRRIVLVVILVVGMILLQALMIVSATASTIFVLFLLRSLRSQFKFGIYLLLILIFVVTATIVFIAKFDISKNLIDYDLEAWKGWNSINLRFALWEVSTKAIYENPIWGVGIGDAQNELLNTYKSNNFYFGAYNNYQPHNQLIMTWLMAGIPGVIMILSFFVFAFRSAYRQPNYLYLGLILIIVLFCLTDIPLLRNKPLVFFMFFVTLFENLGAGERNVQ